MQSTTPKQYLDLDGEPLLLHTLRRLAELDGLAGIVLVLSEDDRWWPDMAADATRLAVPLMVCKGGDERFESVSNGLAALEDRATDEDWVLVHDAARPCVRVTDMLRLLDVAGNHVSGGILATPVGDTLKR
ncbi:MAG: IspD/TarI family cytidylyltransferase, partial [Pseudomonadota bacterium]